VYLAVEYPLFVAWFALIYSNFRNFGKPSITVMFHCNFVCWMYMLYTRSGLIAVEE
jgi:hypothetical protein